MPIKDELLKILCCPVSKKTVRALTVNELEQVNSHITASSCIPIEHTYMSSALILSTVFQSTRHTWSIPIASMLISSLAFILPPSMLTHYSHLREIRTVVKPLFYFSYTNTIYVSVSRFSGVFILLSGFLLQKNLFHEINFFPNMPYNKGLRQLLKQAKWSRII